MGTPVLMTDWPRLRPSVCSIEIVRTVLSPKCCATSKTSRIGKSGTSSAVVMDGKFPSKRTSTTAPITYRNENYELSTLSIILLHRYVLHLAPFHLNKNAKTYLITVKTCCINRWYAVHVFNAIRRHQRGQYGSLSAGMKTKELKAQKVKVRQCPTEQRTCILI